MPAKRIRLEPRTARRPQALPAIAIQIPQGFMVCPPALLIASAWQQAIYRLAYERARAEVEIPRHHRFLFSVWN